MYGDIQLTSSGELIQVYNNTWSVFGKNCSPNNGEVCSITLDQPVKVINGTLVSQRDYKKGDCVFAEPYIEEQNIWSMTLMILENSQNIPYLEHLQCNTTLGENFLKAEDKFLNEDLYLKLRKYNYEHILKAVSLVVTNYSSTNTGISLSYFYSRCDYSNTPKIQMCVKTDPWGSGELRNLYGILCEDQYINSGLTCMVGIALTDITKGTPLSVIYTREILDLNTLEFVDQLTTDTLIHGNVFYNIQKKDKKRYLFVCEFHDTNFKRLVDIHPTMIQLDANEKWKEHAVFVEEHDRNIMKEISDNIDSKTILVLIMLFSDNMRNKRLIRFICPDSYKRQEKPGIINSIHVKPLEKLGLVCGHCVKIQKKHIRRCSWCIATVYCSKDCQNADWKNHRKICSRNYK